jgi:cytochrome c oxidase subunit 2
MLRLGSILACSPIAVSRHAPGFALLVLAALGTTACGVESLSPVTTQGRAITGLFNFVLVLSAGVFLLVTGLLVYIVVRYRGRPGEADPPQVHGNRTLEIAWTAAPLLLLGALFIPTIATMASVDAPSPSALRVEVIGHQWWWEYRYPDLGLVTANELHVPVGQPLRLDLGAADVVHSFWVPRFGWKRDTIPAKTNVLSAQVEEAGVYDGACTEYCGLQHAWMRIKVVAQPASEFDAWIAGQRAVAASPATDLQRRGQQVFANSTCSQCHMVRGTAAGAQVGPDLTHVGSRTQIAAGVLDNSAQNLARFIKDPNAVKPGALMPSFQTFSDDDLEALAAYLDGLK